MAITTTTKPAVSTPFRGRDPKNAPRCPLHGVRMQYDPNLSDRGGMRCPQRQNGERCTFIAFPRCVSPTLLRNTSYSGPVRLFVHKGATDDAGDPTITVYLQLVELGLLVDVTRYVDMDRGGIIMPADGGSDHGLDLTFRSIDLG
jgi:hypothetical protein